MEDFLAIGYDSALGEGGCETALCVMRRNEKTKETEVLNVFYDNDAEVMYRQLIGMNKLKEV